MCSYACLWDNDTLEMERQRFPGVLELITGKFLRHSDAYYQWRIEDRKTKLQSTSSPELYDDLAVAYDKLGEQGKAIEVAAECERKFPGRYETAANLGTFHIHAGNFEKGLGFISLALEINPDAHFGREHYQKLLVEYLLSKRTEGKLSFPLDPIWPEEEFYAHHSRGFAKFCEDENAAVPQPVDEEELITEALLGVQGMMNFGHYNSPVLLEALGDLLLAGHRDTDTKRLAARAYLQAAESYEDADMVDVYRHLAAKALEIHVAHDAAGMPPLMTIEELERRFQSEFQDANQWYSQLVEREREWIASNKDVDVEFRRVYYEAAQPQTQSPVPWTYGQLLLRRVALALGSILAVALVGAYILRMFFRAKRTVKGGYSQDEAG